MHPTQLVELTRVLGTPKAAQLVRLWHGAKQAGAAEETLASLEASMREEVLGALKAGHEKMAWLNGDEVPS